MLDQPAHRLISPGLNWLGSALAGKGISANGVSLLGAALGIGCGIAIAMAQFWGAGLLLLLSRLADGLDGAIARQRGISDFGGYLDIVCDFVFYAAIPLGFAALDPPGNALAAAALLASFYLNGASFLGFAILAERRGLETARHGIKSLYFSTGLVEGTETIAFFVAMLVWPAWFVWLAYVFALLCLLTMIGRLVLAWRLFGVDVDDRGRHKG